jgi:hypothetical protein
MCVLHHVDHPGERLSTGSREMERGEREGFLVDSLYKYKKMFLFRNRDGWMDHTRERLPTPVIQDSFIACSWMKR